MGGRQTIDPLALEFDKALRRFDQPQDGFEGRRFARGIASQQTYDLTLVDLDVDVLQDRNGAVLGIDVLQLEQGSRFHDPLSDPDKPRSPARCRSLARMSNPRFCSRDPARSLDPTRLARPSYHAR